MRIPARPAAIAAAAALGLAACTGAGSAAAAPATAGTLSVVRTLPGSWIAPLQFAVGKQVYAADSAASALYRVGRKSPIALGPTPSSNPEQSGDLAGVAVEHGRIAYTTTEADHRNTYLTVLQHGQQVLRVNLGRYERQHNPDGGVAYGVADPAAVSPKCAAEITKAGAPLHYGGLKDSHAYAVAGIADGGWLVADAGGNDVLHVEPDGRTTTFAVLPPQPVTITKALAKTLHAPDCVGITYAFEAVPTDVEIGPDAVYVSTLPGGEGGLGSVYRVDWRTNAVTLVATGFPAATNLAVTERGKVYVASLGTGVYTPGVSGPELVAEVPGAAGVEWCDGRLYVSTAPAVLGGKGPGRIVVLG